MSKQFKVIFRPTNGIVDTFYAKDMDSAISILSGFPKFFTTDHFLEEVGYISPKDAVFLREINKPKTVPTETVGTAEPLQTEAGEYVVALKELRNSYVGPEQVLNSFKETVQKEDWDGWEGTPEKYEIPHNRNDKAFPIDRPLKPKDETLYSTNPKDYQNEDGSLKTGTIPGYIEELKGEITTQTDTGRAIRHDEGKPHMDLLSPIAMFGTAQVMTHGLKKYPGSQWKKGMAWSKVTASLLRHMFKFMAGEDVDEETGCLHIDCVAANAMFLQEYARKHKDLDDRMKTGLE